MSKSKFLEFVAKNPPPCVLGDKLYWFDKETGAIRMDKNPIGQIALDQNWEWKIVDEDSANHDLITPNESEYFCLTPEDAKKFRDKVESVDYTVLKENDSIGVPFENNPSKRLGFVKSGILTDIKSIGIDEDYISAIIKTDSDIEVGMFIMILTRVYQVCEGGKIRGNRFKVKMEIEI